MLPNERMAVSRTFACLSADASHRAVRTPRPERSAGLTVNASEPTNVKASAALTRTAVSGSLSAAMRGGMRAARGLRT